MTHVAARGPQEEMEEANKVNDTIHEALLHTAIMRSLSIYIELQTRMYTHVIHLYMCMCVCA